MDSVWQQNMPETVTWTTFPVYSHIPHLLWNLLFLNSHCSRLSNVILLYAQYFYLIYILLYFCNVNFSKFLFDFSNPLRLSVHSASPLTIDWRQSITHSSEPSVTVQYDGAGVKEKIKTNKKLSLHDRLLREGKYKR